MPKVKPQNTILGDMTAIRNFGMQYYQSHYFWPVPDDEYQEFVHFMHRVYIRLIIDLSDNAFDIALIEYKLVSEMFEGVFHYNYLTEFSKSNNINLEVGRESKNYRYPDWKKFSSFYSKQVFPFGRVKRYVRRVAKNIVFNKHLPIWKIIKGFLTPSAVVGIGSFDILKKEYVVNNNIYCDHRDWPDLISSDANVAKNNRATNWSKEVVNKVIKPFLKEMKDHKSMFVHDVDFVIIENAWINRVKDLSNIYSDLISTKNKPKVLLVTEMAKFHSRMITMAYQREGCRVLGFHHGNDVGLTVYKIGHDIGRAHCKEIVVPTQGIAHQFRKIYSQSLIEKRVKTKYISTNSNLYKDLATINGHRVKRIKRIMLMGTPANPNRYIHEQGQFFYIKVDLEFRIMNDLIKNGFEVVYKAHPDRLQEIKGLFESQADEYNAEPFEKVWDSVDAYVFTDTASTTFGFSLATNKDIFLFNNTADERNPYLDSLLKKRVNLIPMFLDGENRMQYSPMDMSESINNPIIDLDKGFQEEIFC
jgi:hypothetical protein